MAGMLVLSDAQLSVVGEFILGFAIHDSEQVLLGLIAMQFAKSARQIV